MLPIILIDTKLYQPYFKNIFNTIQSGKKFKESETKYLKDYLNVVFPVGYDDTNGQKVISHYQNLVQLAVRLENEHVLKQLQELKCDLNTTDITSYSLIGVALDCVMQPNSSDKSQKILDLLLKDDNVECYHYCSLLGQNHLHQITQHGDLYYDFVLKIANKVNKHKNILNGENPLNYSIIYQQYKTANYLLKTEDAQTLVNYSSDNNVFPLHRICTYAVDPEEGLALMKVMLQWTDPNTYLGIPVMFNVLLNPNPKCRLIYIETLLASGVNPNQKNEAGEPIIMGVLHHYLEALDKNDHKTVKNYSDIFEVFLKYKVDLMFDTPIEHIPFLKCIMQKRAINLVKIVGRYIDQNEDLHQSARIILEKSDRNVLSEGGNESKQIYGVSYQLALAYINEQRDILYLKDEIEKQEKLLMLLDKYTFEVAQKTIKSELVKILQNGNLKPENILKLITILSKNEEYKEYFPYFYREYIVNIIVYFFKLDKYKKDNYLRNLYMFAYKLVENIQFMPEDKRENFYFEINDILQRIIQLTLVTVYDSQLRGLDKFIDWINCIHEKYPDLYDDETKCLVLQLKITHAFNVEDTKLFSELYAKINIILPIPHILRRQYDYWNAVLLFKHARREDIVILENAFDKLYVYSFPIELLKYFIEKLQLFRKEIYALMEKEKAQRKLDKNIAKDNVGETLHHEIHNHNASTINLSAQNIPVDTNNNNKSNTNTNTNLNNKTEIEPQPRIKQKTRGIPYPEMQMQAMQELQQRLNPEILNPIYTEAEVRRIYSKVLSDNDQLKPVFYVNKYGEHWMVCNFDNFDLEKKLKDQFIKEFNKSNKIRPYASSGLSFKKTFRLMLGNNDPRLHSTLYKNKQNTCALIRLDELWVHKDENIERRTVNIEDVEPCAKLSRNKIN